MLETSHLIVPGVVAEIPKKKRASLSSKKKKSCKTNVHEKKNVQAFLKPIPFLKCIL